MALLAVSMGDPAGIGPEVILKAATVKDARESAVVVYGDPDVLERASVETSVSIRIERIQHPSEARAHLGTDVLPVIAVSSLPMEGFGWGRPTHASDVAQVEYIKRAFGAVAAGDADALVTAPISKAALSRAGAPWAGHTEMLAELSGVERPVMMLAGPTLKVVPLTTHVALRDVPGLLSIDRILHALRVTDTSFRRYFARKPRIGVAGLNPHAGEGGMFGTEEQQFIIPAIQQAKAAGIDAYGPFSADTVFNRAVSGELDVVIGMYHDQALIPLKLLDFDTAVNVTLGLPIIRTSVDHGTAYDIAGQGVASAHSMIAAMRLAVKMSHGRAGQTDSSAARPAGR